MSFSSSRLLYIESFLHTILKCSFTMHYTSSLRKAECCKCLASSTLVLHMLSLAPSHSLCVCVCVYLAAKVSTKHNAIKLLFIFVFVPSHHPSTEFNWRRYCVFFSLFPSLSHPPSLSVASRSSWLLLFSFVSKSHLCFIYETIHQNSIRGVV